MSKQTGLRVRREIWFSDISWSRVHDALCHHFQVSQTNASKLINDFCRRFLRPLNLYWFSSERLSPADNLVLAALCESQGVDIVMLRHEQPLWFASLPLSCKQAIEFRPELRLAHMHSDPGSCAARMAVAVRAKEIPLDNFGKLLSVQAFGFVLAIVFYVLLIGMFLYSLSVFTLFLASPWEVAATATEHGSIALALFSFLVLSAALCGRLVKSTVLSLYRRFFRRVNYGKPVHTEKCAPRV